MANTAKAYFFIVTCCFIGWSAYKISQILTPPPIPKFDENAYWGPGNPKPDDKSIRPFKISIPDKVLEDLNRRLDATRDLTPSLEGVDFQYGFNSETLKKVLQFWRKEYKWRQREAFLNKFPQFKTQIQGLDIHYIHVKPKAENTKNVLPLLLLHGWPGSIREFYELLPLLTEKRQDNADFVFEVIVPSLPGYGFSQGASKTGLGPAEIGVIYKQLMKRLGYEKFYVQGGDWGAIIANNLATIYPQNILGHHSNLCGTLTAQSFLKILAGSLVPSLVVSSDKADKIYPLSNLFSFIMEEFGYMHLQATKPDTLGVGLTDSPAGLAAYILEKFSTWTDKDWRAQKDGGLLKKYKFEDLLDNVMIYWVTNSITTSVRLYSEAFNKRTLSMHLDSIPTEVPTACSKFKHELAYVPDSLLRDKYVHLVYTNELETGGHFAAFEVPEVLAKEIWTAFANIEYYRNNNNNVKFSYSG